MISMSSDGENHTQLKSHESEVSKVNQLILPPSHEPPRTIPIRPPGLPRHRTSDRPQPPRQTQPHPRPKP
jgi:hypothetical protein